MADAQRHRDFIERYHSRISPASLQAADVLLTEAGNLRELFLRQAFSLPDSPDVPAHQLAHVHAQWLADYTL